MTYLEKNAVCRFLSIPGAAAETMGSNSSVRTVADRSPRLNPAADSTTRLCISPILRNERIASYHSTKAGRVIVRPGAKWG